MCNLNHNSMLKLAAACLLGTLSASTLADALLESEASLSTATLSSSRIKIENERPADDFIDRPQTGGECEMDVTPRPGDEEALLAASLTKPAEKPEVGKPQSSRELSVPQANPVPKPEPAPEWTDIKGGDVHMLRLVSSGISIISIEAANSEAPLEYMIFDQEWNLLVHYDTNGCGAYFIMEPQTLRVVIMNPHRTSNAYRLTFIDRASPELD